MTTSQSLAAQPRSDLPPAVLAKLSENIRARRALKKVGYRVRSTPGTFNRNLMFQWTYEGVEYALHATKGWRIRVLDDRNMKKAERV